jgi:hypothetical protein
MESPQTPAPYAVTTLQFRFTAPAMAVLAGSAMPTTFSTRKNHRFPVPGERFRLFTAKGPVLFEVLEREFQFLEESTTVRLTLDIPSES